MKYVKAAAPGKVNISLRVGKVREDGFHPLDTVFEALDIYEIVEAWNDPSGEISLSFAEGTGGGLPTDGRNIVVRAAHLVREYCAVHALSAYDNPALLGARIRITKGIPIAGGMAGGSADAAATLVALVRLWELDIAQEDLAALAAQLGSDVPFCLMGGLARGQGRGEKLTAIQAGCTHGFVLLINPRGLSTPDVFHEYDRLCAMPRSQVSQSRAEAGTPPALCAALGGKDLRAIGQLMVNDLEEPAFSLRPDVGAIVHSLRSAQCGSVQGAGSEQSGSAPSGNVQGGASQGADADIVQPAGVILSGSGPTVAVLCEPQHREAMRELLSSEFPQLRLISATGPAQGAHVVCELQ